MQQLCRSSTVRPVNHVCCSAERTHSHSIVRNGRDRSTAALGAVDLPHGVLWWNDKSHSVYQHDVLHGQDFVLQRSRPGGPGLVLARQVSTMQIVDKEEQRRVGMQMYQQGSSSGSTQLATSDMFTFDITDYALADEAPSAQLAAQQYLLFPPTNCTGIVLRNDASRQQYDEATEQVVTNHSRRTKAVKFTCKRCGVSSLKAVNPNAWATGTVFARCDGCQVIHKLTDNLDLFHELAGPVLEPQPNLELIQIPDSLPQNPYMP